MLVCIGSYWPPGPRWLVLAYTGAYWSILVYVGSHWFLEGPPIILVPTSLY